MLQISFNFYPVKRLLMCYIIYIDFKTFNFKSFEAPIIIRYNLILKGGVAELADAADLKSAGDEP